MAVLLVLYPKPADPSEFDRYYFETHVPIAKQIPGLLRFQVSRGEVGSPAGGSQFHLVAMLEFESLATIQAALDTPECRAATDDLRNFAPEGVQVHFYDSKLL